jgi:hypothetical protein
MTALALLLIILGILLIWAGITDKNLIDEARGLLGK